MENNETSEIRGRQETPTQDKKSINKKVVVSVLALVLLAVLIFVFDIFGFVKSREERLREKETQRLEELASDNPTVFSLEDHSQMFSEFSGGSEEEAGEVLTEEDRNAQLEEFRELN